MQWCLRKKILNLFICAFWPLSIIMGCIAANSLLSTVSSKWVREFANCTWQLNHQRCFSVNFLQILMAELRRPCMKMWKSAQLPHVKESDKKFLYPDLDPDYVHNQMVSFGMHFPATVKISLWYDVNCGCYRVHRQTDRQTDKHTERTNILAIFASNN